MDKIIIEGGNKLSGEVRISGSKNASLPILAATILTDEDCIIHNVPDLQDIGTMIKLLEIVGKKCFFEEDRITIKKNKALKPFAPYDLVRKMRASVLLLGPLLARCLKADVSLPGGCAIGLRPVNIHINALKALGAKEKLMHGYVSMHAKKLIGNKIIFDFPSVGATENILMAATLSSGITLIENFAKEPEIDDLINFLNSMGANVIQEKNYLKITGVEKLKGIEYTVIPDRIEAGTYLIAAAITGGDVKVSPVIPEHIENILQKLIEAGENISIKKDTVHIKAIKTPKQVDIETMPYPGFPTDMQAQWMVLMCIARDSSQIIETVFENRFMHVQELLRMGADIKIKGNVANIKGKTKFLGASVMATDLRASAALVLAGLIAAGKTEILRVYHLDRGYEKIEEKLSALGAKIRRVKNN